jgi:hypothetical protein
MRIAFLIEWDAYASSGVLTKVEAQVRTWRSQGHEAQVFVVTPRRNEALAIDLAISTPIFLPLPFTKRQFFNKIAVSHNIFRYLKQFGPDVIYYRQSLWYPGQVRNLSRVAPYVVELNSLSVEEFRMKNRYIGAFYSFTEPWLLGGASGFVAVSGEIAKHYACDDKPIAVVANGYPVTKCEPRSPINNERPQLIFVGTPRQKWHGLDKVARMAACFQNWDFHVVGPEATEIERMDLPNIFFHGYLQQTELSLLYRHMDVGIGTLALHRNSMNEASPLKVREYVAHGLPVFAGYHDSDLSGCDFFLNIGNTEDNVIEQQDAIAAFVEHWQGQSINRSDVLGLVDVSVKESKRLSFMVEVVAHHGKNSKAGIFS